MALKDFAYYSVASGLIENVILLDDEHINTLVDFPPPQYAIVEMPEDIQSGQWSTCGIGWSYLNGQFVEPPAPEKVMLDGQPISQGAQTL